MFCLADTSCDISILSLKQENDPTYLKEFPHIYVYIYIYIYQSRFLRKLGKWFNSTKTFVFETGCFNHQLYSLLNSSCCPSQSQFLFLLAFHHVGHSEEGCRRQRCTASCPASGRARQATSTFRKTPGPLGGAWSRGCFYKRLISPPPEKSLELR